jgi:hypothetical protein
VFAALTMRPLDLAGGDVELRFLPAVDEEHVALVQLVRIAEGRDLACPVELEVVEQEHPLSIHGRLACGTDDQRAVETALELLRLVDVRVVPERPGVGHLEAVLEGFARLHRLVGRLGPVHLGRNA